MEKRVTKRILSFLTALVMAFSMRLTAFAANTPVDSKNGGQGSIEITLPSDKVAGSEYTYSVYKVFDATSAGEEGNTAIAYTVMESKKDTALPTGFVTDAAGNVYHGTKGDDGTITESTATELTADEIAAIKTYVGSDKPVVTAKATALADDTDTITISGLEYGYYYITTITGSLVTVNSTNPEAKVNDKNSAPTITKVISAVETGSKDKETDATNAIAQSGSVVTYTSTVTVGKGAVGYVFKDKMDDTLKLITAVGDGATEEEKTRAKNYPISVKLQKKGETTQTDVPATSGEATNWTLDTTAVADKDENTHDGYTFKITFDDAYTATLSEGDQLIITYSAVVASVDLREKAPAHNRATISYGNESQYTSTEQSTSVYNAEISAKKTDGSGNALPGAGFVLKNSEGKYYKLTSTTTTPVDPQPSEESTPADILLVFDQTNSLSTAMGSGTRLSALKNAATTFVNGLTTNDKSKIALMTFVEYYDQQTGRAPVTTKMRWSSLTDSTKNSLVSTINGLSVKSSTYGYATSYVYPLQQAASMLDSGSNSRKYVIFFSDGDADADQMEDQDNYTYTITGINTAAGALKAKATVFAIASGGFNSMTKINAVASSGTAYTADSAEALVTAFNSALGTIKSQTGGSGSSTTTDTDSYVVTWVDSISDADVHTSDADGNVAAFKGLADGTYSLVESVVPAGYNAIGDTSVTINAASAEGALADKTNLVKNVDIVNQAGSVLPSTGGMGTTLFYLLGAVLVIGAGVVLVTRRRLSR